MVAQGKAADLVVFDPHTVGAGETKILEDPPRGEGRFVQIAGGIHAVLVNGAPGLAGLARPGALPGQMSRAGV